MGATPTGGNCNADDFSIVNILNKTVCGVDMGGGGGGGGGDIFNPRKTYMYIQSQGTWNKVL